MARKSSISSKPDVTERMTEDDTRTRSTTQRNTTHPGEKEFPAHAATWRKPEVPVCSEMSQ
jgi:hypothetical protein